LALAWNVVPFKELDKQLKMSEVRKGNTLDLGRDHLNDEDFLQILTKLSSPREEHPPSPQRKRREGPRLSGFLAHLPTNVWRLIVSGNRGIGDAGMMHLHLIPDSLTNLSLNDCGLTPLGIKRVCEFLKTNKSITAMAMTMVGNPMGAEGVKDLADVMKENTTLRVLSIDLYTTKTSTADCCHLSDGLALNNRLVQFSIYGRSRLTDEHVKNLCPGLTVNRSLEVLNLSCARKGITEMGVGYLEKILHTNVYLKFVDISHHPTGTGINWNKMNYWLSLNKCNRKLLRDPSTTPKQWRDAIILSSKAGNPDAIYMFLTNKADWLCMMMVRSF
jgi:hypothetical protein